MVEIIWSQSPDTPPTPCHVTALNNVTYYSDKTEIKEGNIKESLNKPMGVVASTEQKKEAAKINSIVG